MIQYLPIVLICNSLLAPSECKEGGRDTTLVVGELQNTPMSCMKEANERSSRLAFAPKLGDTFYIKIRCVPRDMANER